jgi:hypothetical protein
MDFSKFETIPEHLERYKRDLPRLSPDAALERQLSNEQYFSNDEVASTLPEHEPTNPAEIGDQFIDITNKYGTGKLPVVASRRLDRAHPDVEEIYVVQHGEIRNVHTYFNNFMSALSTVRDMDKILVVCPQFPTAHDPIDDTILRWDINGWRGLEPAIRPSPPISSAEADDQLHGLLYEICPNAQIFHERDNSEGGQKANRMAAWSFAFQDLELLGREVQVATQNPGYYQYWSPIRGRLINNPKVIYFEDVEWEVINPNSDANRWPYALYYPNREDFDAFGPPPHVRKFMQQYSPLTAFENVLRRAHIIIGSRDNDPYGSRLPVGEGPDRQGLTRDARAAIMCIYMNAFKGDCTDTLGITFVEGCDHDAAKLFDIVENLVDIHDNSLHVYNRFYDEIR